MSERRSLARTAKSSSARASPAGSQRSQRNGRRAMTYAEDTDSSDSDDEPLAARAASNRRQVAASTSTLTSTATATPTKRRNPAGQLPQPKKKREQALSIGRPRPANTTTKDRPQNLSLKAVPPWPEPAKLPYDVLLSIFQYAAYPLLDEAQKTTPRAKWLVRVASVRRDFLEPALAALYYCPPLEPPSRAHGLLDALQAQTEDSLIDYGRKIRYLEIDAASILCFKWYGREPMELARLVSMAPMLRGIRLNWPNDDPAVISFNVRPPTKYVPMFYGEPLFRLLDDRNISLTEWKWNFLIGSKLEYPWRHLTEIHSRPAFRQLRSLELCRIGSHMWNTIDFIPSIGLGELTQLEELTVSIPAYMDSNAFLPLLENVRALRTLRLLTCDDLDSDFLDAILEHHGTQLRHLVLNHNRSLDLGFLGALQHCPRLESLEMDLTFYSSLGSIRVASPGFDTLLPDGCTPKWPTTLQRLQLAHLRKWDSTAAARLFNSLLEASPALPALRVLEVRASVDADWRDRIRFRDLWEARLPRVFLRRDAPPRRWTGWDEQGHNGTGTKRSERQKAAASGPDDEDEDGPIHGRCDRVDVRIENLRPMDRQFDESNFLDDEHSGDEDYVD